MRVHVLVVCVAASVAACGKSQESGASVGSAGAASVTASAATPTASSSATTTAPAPAASGAAALWRGTYKSAAATMTVAPAWKKGHWSGPASNAGLGEGTVAIDVDPTTHRVTGTLDGPLGPATIDGVADEGKLTASIARKDPSDRGFTGTLVATVTADHVEGTMNVAPGQAGELRTATFTLSPAGR